MIRGEAPALWILSKMAMIFFIITLAGIILVASSVWQTNLCYSQAETLAQSVSSSIGDLLNTPVEDQRQVVNLPSSIQASNGVDSRYELNISQFNNGVTTALLVLVYSDYDPSCKAQVTIPYNASAITDMYFIGPTGRSYSSNPDPNIKAVLQLEPSYIDQTTPTTSTASSRSTFLSVIKCESKCTNPQTYFFIEDCTDLLASNCLNINTEDPNQNAGSSDPSVLCGYPSSTQNTCPTS